MSGIINRAQYGNLSCAWAVFKSRYTNPGDVISLGDLKATSPPAISSVDVCIGAEIAGKIDPFPLGISKKRGRSRYCPFLKDRMDNRFCQWVHSTLYDPQKSKAVGQAAIMLQVLGLVDHHLNTANRISSIEWTKKAASLSTHKWGSSQLDSYLTKKVLSYGPLLALAYNIQQQKENKISGSDFRQKMMILPSSDCVQVQCSKGTTTLVAGWDGNTSNDAASRTTSALLTMAASVGLVRPSKYTSGTLSPSSIGMWLGQRAVKGAKGLPRNYVVQRTAINSFFGTVPIIENGIQYNHFMPKTTHRNEGDRCSGGSCDCGGENVINLAKKQFGHIVINRRMLLIESLKYASENGMSLDLRKLATASELYPELCIDKSTHFSTLVNIERLNVIFFGFPNKLEQNHVCVPLVNAKNTAFGQAPVPIDRAIKQILNPTILV